MTKKDYVLKLLELLKGNLSIAEGLIILVRETKDVDKVIDILATIFGEVIEDTLDEDVKEKLEKAKTFLETLRANEAASQEMDKKDLAHLDEMLQSI